MRRKKFPKCAVREMCKYGVYTSGWQCSIKLMRILTIYKVVLTRLISMYNHVLISILSMQCDTDTVINMTNFGTINTDQYIKYAF